LSIDCNSQRCPFPYREDKISLDLENAEVPSYPIYREPELTPVEEKRHPGGITYVAFALPAPDGDGAAPAPKQSYADPPFTIFEGDLSSGVAALVATEIAPAAMFA
jgi:hypothetical protein